MAKRDIIFPEAQPFAVGNQRLMITAISGNEIRVQTPDGGYAVRGINVSADDNYIRNEAGEWESYVDTRTSRSMTVRRTGTFDDGTPAQRKFLMSTFRQAVQAFAAENPLLLARAAVLQANNDIYRADSEVAKTEKAYNEALDVRRAAIEREREAIDALALLDEAPAPRM